MRGGPGVIAGNGARPSHSERVDHPGMAAFPDGGTFMRGVSHISVSHAERVTMTFVGRGEAGTTLVAAGALRAGRATFCCAETTHAEQHVVG